MRVTVRYFALLREAAGRESETVDLPNGASTLADLLAALKERHGGLGTYIRGRNILCAVNQEYTGREAVLEDGDEVALLPPVSGGGEVKVRIQKEDFDLTAALKEVKGTSRSIGGVVAFVGVVRDISQGQEVEKLDFEYFPGMAEKKLEDLREEAVKRFELTELLLVHRWGRLFPGDNIVLIVSAARHREKAFEASAWCIAELKKRVPIWKKEHTASGEVWVDGDPEP